MFNSKLITFLLVVMLAVSSPSAAQIFRFELYDTDGIPADVYAQRRAALLATLPENGVLIVHSADVRNRQNDVDYEYRQDSDMLYLTGFPYPNATLLLSRSGVKVGTQITNEILFVRPRVRDREQWTGVEMGEDEAKELLKIDVVLPNTQLVTVLKSALGDERSSGPRSTSPDTLFMPRLPTPTVGMALLGKNLSVTSELRRGLTELFPNVVLKTSLPQLAAMRMVKDKEELRLLQHAVDISIEGHLATIKGAKPGMKEYQLEALMEYTFKKLGAEDVGYPSIVGSSYNACILHYNSNRRTANKNELVLADCGAEYRGYTADITRTFPVNGKFTADQLTIYNIVKEAQDSGIKACVVGAPFKAAHNAAMSVVSKNLIKLGIINTESDAKKYFMHGTSHYLGLDVHDPGTYGPLTENVVITVEPGIYIAEGSDCDKRWWNIGVRIEDDILVTKDGPVNMSAKLPRNAAEIEQLMQQP
jgi:Xaa-Pro aminopeptidase